MKVTPQSIFFLTPLCLLVAGCNAPAPAAPAPPTGANELVLLDETWKPELKLQNVQTEIINATQDGDPRVHDGRSSLLLKNDEGAPLVRIQRAGNLEVRQLLGEPAQLKLCIAPTTGRKNGRCKSSLFTSRPRPKPSR